LLSETGKDSDLRSGGRCATVLVAAIGV